MKHETSSVAASSGAGEPPCTAPLGKVANVTGGSKAGDTARQTQLKDDTPRKSGAKKVPPPKRKSELQAALARAKKMKLEYNAAAAQATQLQTSIAANTWWTWARADSIQGDFLKSKHALDNVLHDDSFMRAVLSVSDLSELKSDFDPATVQVKLLRMTEAMEPVIASLAKQCRVLLAQQRARMSADTA